MIASTLECPACWRTSVWETLFKIWPTTLSGYLIIISQEWSSSESYQTGVRPHRGPKKKFRGHLKLAFNSCNIQLVQFEYFARNRQTLCSLCYEGNAYFELIWREELEEKRRQRHRRHTNNIIGNFFFNLCSRKCHSKIGLFSQTKSTV